MLSEIEFTYLCNNVHINVAPQTYAVKAASTNCKGVNPVKLIQRAVELALSFSCRMCLRN
jgi:hypothetical protein